MRAGPKSLTEREAHELALTIHDQWLEWYRDNPSEQVFWRPDLGEKVFAPPPPIDLNVITDAKSLFMTWDADSFKILEMEKWCLNIAAQCLKARRLAVDEPSRPKVAKAVAAAVQRAS